MNASLANRLPALLTDVAITHGEILPDGLELSGRGPGEESRATPYAP